VRDDLCRREGGIASDRRAGSRLQRVVRRGCFNSLLADVHPGIHQLLDGAGAGNRVWLLQPVQHRADAGRGVSRRVQGGVHFRLAGAAGLECAGARAGEYFKLVGLMAVAARRRDRVGAGLGMVLARVRAPLHQREFVKNYG